ncbi:MAG: threonine--tRNA ligase [Nanoarchaeota archaeon]|nr:threonine--tRNA ligase [Nanoarchaeota archaeon]
MKLLSLHCDYIRFRPLKKALKDVEPLNEKEKAEKTVKEVLVILTAVEKGDNEEIQKEYTKNVEEIAKQVNTKRIVLYPYAHLSSNLSAPGVAIKILKDSEEGLKKDGYEVIRAPFGYYKEFELKVKGHPLSELSRELKSRTGTLEQYDPKQLLREISKTKLDTSKLKKNDHRIIGQEMNLFSFNEVAPGMVFWHNNGLIIKNELINFWREVHKDSGYEEISTPQIMDSKLWKISGHWDKYKDNNFVTEYEKRHFLVKPMNCPGGMLVYRSRPKSYKDLPLRVGELGIVHRVELSGVLAGLFRVVQFTQDDAHIFCTEEQTQSEIFAIMDLIEMFYKKLKIEFDHVELSTRPEKRIGSEEMWDKAEKMLEDALKNRKMKYKINKGDGAFYGPKIDFHVKDSLGRTWQLSTIQLDFSMPERFELEYIDKDNTRKRPVMLHRVIYGAIERFLGILLEHTSGRLPTWLAPMQVRILSFTERNEKYARKIIKEIGERIPGIRLDADFRNTTVSAKVKDAESMRIPYIIVVGDKEEKESGISIRERGDNKIRSETLGKFIEELAGEIKERA